MTPISSTLLVMSQNWPLLQSRTRTPCFTKLSSGKRPFLSSNGTSADSTTTLCAFRIPATEEVFFAQNAGSLDAGTGLAKSAIIQKVSVAEALQIASGNKTGHVKVETVTSNPPVINPNGTLLFPRLKTGNESEILRTRGVGGTNYKGNILFAGEGMGNKTASALYSVNPLPPYNATILVNNFYGRQFNSLNDIGINPRNSHIYFTDPLYGYFQAFRPPPALPVQVYQLNPETMAVTVAADGFDQANGKSIPLYFIQAWPVVNFNRNYLFT